MHVGIASEIKTSGFLRIGLGLGLDYPLVQQMSPIVKEDDQQSGLQRRLSNKITRA